ncbi:Cysteine/O-acetylserine efflux protein [bacterium YEK0313]|nr:Cysteine/O-acetylserine efflux protein [bacterium YEK0313]
MRQSSETNRAAAMTPELLIAFATYAFVTSITPGPNNTMLLASGANFGFGPTVPHIFGISLGFAAMVLAVGLGAGALFVAFPLAHDILRYGGAFYLMVLAWRLARSGAGEAAAAGARPLTFLEAAAFQWVNPKAWIMAVGAVATYTPEAGYLLNVVIVTIVFALINGPCVSIWAGFGTALRGVLSKPVHLRVFNVAMALLLVASLYPMLA